MMEKDDEIQPFSFNLGFFIILHFIMTWFGLFPSVLFGYWYFTTFPISFEPLYLILLIPFCFLFYGIALVSSLVSTKIGIWLIHKRNGYPKLGTYRLSMDTPQTRSYFLKGNIKNFGRWLYYSSHLQFLRVFWMRRMGVKIGKNVHLGEWVEDEETVEIGDNNFMAREIVIAGHMMDNDDLTLVPTIIGKNCIFNFATGGAGAKVGDNSVLMLLTAFLRGKF